MTNYHNLIIIIINRVKHTFFNRKSEENKLKEEFLHSFISDKAITPFFISLAGVTYPNPNYHINIQKRDITVIEYVVDGTGYVFFDKKYNKVDADTIYILNQGEHHKYFADKNDPYSKIFLNISGSMAKELPSMYGLGNDHLFVNKQLRSTFERIPQTLNSSLSEEHMQIELQIILTEIFTKLSFSISKEKKCVEAVKLKEYIDSNTDKIINMSELSKLIFRSVDYSQKLFLREFKTTPYEYQINRKIIIAKNLLTNTDISIGELGASLGYNDPHYFSNIFKTKTGLSPSKYRKEINKPHNKR